VVYCKEERALKLPGRKTIFHTPSTREQYIYQDSILSSSKQQTLLIIQALAVNAVGIQGDSKAQSRQL
jgi:hypothetical protein